MGPCACALRLNHAPPPTPPRAQEVNYGVPWPVNLDALFGSWCPMEWVDATRGKDGKASIRAAKRYGQLLAQLGSADAARAALAKEAE